VVLFERCIRLTSPQRNESDVFNTVTEEGDSSLLCGDGGEVWTELPVTVGALVASPADVPAHLTRRSLILWGAALGFLRSNVAE